MAHIEIVFLVTIAIFGVVGIVRGFARELGVTTLLLLALFVLEIIEGKAGAQFNQLLAQLVKSGAVGQEQVKTILYCGFLVVVAFISYEGETLSFPSKNQSQVYGAVFGLINGWLFAGSIWYYLDKANWLSLMVLKPYSTFYDFAVNFLPPAIFGWPHLIGLAVFLLILRVWK